MTIALNRPVTRTATTTASTVHRTEPSGDTVTVTLTVSLPAGTSDVESALIADDLRTHARRLTASRQAAVSVGMSAPERFATRGSLRALPPRQDRTVAAVPQRTRRTGVVSPTAPARRDAEAARRRALAATAVSPSSPSDAVTPGLVLDLYGRRLRIDGQDVDLTHKEFELLAHLARRARTTVTRAELMGTVWAGGGEEIGERTVDVHVRRVRSKLGRFRKLVSTVRGEGYRLDPGSDVTLLGGR